MLNSNGTMKPGTTLPRLRSQDFGSCSLLFRYGFTPPIPYEKADVRTCDVGNPVYLVLDDLPSGLEGGHDGKRCVG